MPEPSVDEKVDLAKEHLRRSLMYKEGTRGIFEMRRHLSNYFKGLPHFRETRLKLLTTTDIEVLELLLEYIRKNWSDYKPDGRITSVYGL